MGGVGKQLTPPDFRDTEEALPTPVENPKHFNPRDKGVAETAARSSLKQMLVSLQWSPSGLVTTMALRATGKGWKKKNWQMCL